MLNKFAADSVDIASKMPNNNFNIQNVFYWAEAIAGLVAVCFIIKAGLTYVTSQGDPAKTKKALNTILYAAIGLVIVIISWAITFFVSSSVGGVMQ